MKHKIFKCVLLTGLGLMLTVITSAGFQGCKKDDCKTAVNSIDECFDCLNKNGGCPQGDHTFVLGQTCRCN